MRFGEDAGNEIIKAVRETNRRMRNAEPYRGRWFNQHATIARCVIYYQLSVEGNPSGGTFIIYINDNRPTPSVGYTITLNYDDTATEVTTAIETATGWTGYNIDFFVVDGPLPNNAMFIRLPSDDVVTSVPGSSTVSGYTTNAHNLTRNGPLIPYTRMSSCCR